jgi:hypothetical protein
VQNVFGEISQLQDEFFRELILYVDYYQHQQRNGNTISQVLVNVFQSFQPEIKSYLGITNPHAAQLLFSSIDGLLIAQIYNCKIDWVAQGKMIGDLMEKYAEQLS